MKILIAGGAGFIGSHLCDKFLIEGHQVICVDNLISGSLQNIKHLRKNPQFTFIKHDVIKPLPKSLKADQVFHFASIATPNTHAPVSIHSKPFETMLVNTTGTWNLCEFALKNKAKFMFASTSEAYGEPLEHPQKETYRGNVSTTGPRSIYDEAKRFGETITAAFVRSKNLDGRIIRIFNTYGPRMKPDDGRVVTEFVKACLKNGPIPIFGDGKQTRSFCFVSDLVEGINLVMNSENTKGEIFNLGNPGEFTILELAEKIKEVTNSKSKIIFKEALPQDDPTRRKPDISKAQKMLGYSPKVSLEEGLKKFLEFYQTINSGVEAKR